MVFCQTKNYETFNDLPYLGTSEISNDSLQRLNLIVPVGDGDLPILIWIGGGAWAYVNRHQEMDLARHFAAEGIAVASVGHRLSPATWRDPKLKSGIVHPKHVEDIAAAVKWLYDHAESYGYDREKFFIGGYSSGAHLAALLCMDNKYLSHHGLSQKIFKGVIPISGAYDIVDYHNVFLNGNRPELAKLHVEAVFGDSSHFVEASPTNYLENLSTPMLLISDNSLYNYTKLFEERIKETKFTDVKVVYAENLSHDGLWKNLSFSNNSFYRQIILDFIESNVEGS